MLDLEQSYVFLKKNTKLILFSPGSMVHIDVHEDTTFSFQNINMHTDSFISTCLWFTIICQKQVISLLVVFHTTKKYYLN
jgi:hypothetical protein